MRKEYRFRSRKEPNSDSLTSAREQAQLRVQAEKRKENLKKQLLRDSAQEISLRNEHAAKIGVEKAEARIRTRIEKEISQNYTDVNQLISSQTSPIDAMKIARLISPRFEQKFSFRPQVTKDMEARIRELINE